MEQFLPLVLLLLSLGAWSCAGSPKMQDASETHSCLAGAPSTLHASCMCLNYSGSDCHGEFGPTLLCSGLTEFPVDGPDHTNIICLSVVNSSLSAINSSHLSHFPNLRVLRIIRSELSSVQPGTFDTLTELHHINLADNMLVVVPRIRSSRLSILDLSRNMIGPSIEERVFQDLTVLGHIELDYNQLERLRGQVFYGACRLGSFNFSHNEDLEEIGDEVFDTSNLRTLDVSYTKLKRLPTSLYVRERLENIVATGTMTLKTFEAFTSDTDSYSNKTYPFLRTAFFPYHAHCCQLRVQGFRYQVGDDSDAVEGGSGDPNRTVVLPPWETPSGETPSSGIMCVNRTSLQCLDEGVAQNLVASNATEGVAIFNDSSLFCAAVPSCVSCLNTTCPCATSTSIQAIPTPSPVLEATPTYDSNVQTAPLLGGVMLQATPLPSPEATPTAAPPKIVCLVPEDESDASGPMTFTTMVNQTLCSSHCPTSSPEEGCVRIEKVAVECTGIPLVALPPDPTPPDPCIEARSDPCDVNQYCNCQAAPFDTCMACESASCTGQLGSFLMCAIQFPELCECHTNPPACAHCGSRGRRSAPLALEEVGGVPDMWEDMVLDVGEDANEGEWFKRERRSSHDMDTNSTTVSCSLHENDPFAVEFENFTNVTCQRVIPMTTTLAPSLSTTDFSMMEVCSYIFRTPIEVTIESDTDVFCLPESDPFNPCEDLLGEEDWLRGLIWVVVVLALLGNGLVFIVFIGYAVIVRKCKQDLFVVHFMYFNLACADFLMGVYLLIIASKDIDSLNEFYLTDISWRSGHLCEFAGFCAITSTVVSVYILTVITLERTYTIVRVLSRKKLTKVKAGVIVLFGWALGMLVAFLPLVNVSDYNSVAVCLPFDVSEPHDLFYVTTLLLVTGIAFCVIAVCYSIILQQIVCSRRKSRPYLDSKRKRSDDLKVAIRIFVLIFTNFACWFPIAFFGLAAAFGHNLAGENLTFARVAIVLIFPINACLNPILYSLTTRAFRENMVVLLSYCGICRSKAKVIREARVGITPSVTSKTSEISGVNRVRNTVIMRLRTMSISSQGSTMDLLGRFNLRRGSTMSQSSEESANQMAFLKASRRSSAVSADSSKDLRGVGRGRSDSTFSIDSDEAVSHVIMGNPGFRTSSPEGSRLQPPQLDKTADLRARSKISASSLGAVPEEMEVSLDLTGEGHMIKVNPVYEDTEKEGGESPLTTVLEPVYEGMEREGPPVTILLGAGSQRDSGVIEGSENDTGSDEADLSPRNSTPYQLNMNDKQDEKS